MHGNLNEMIIEYFYISLTNIYVSVSVNVSVSECQGGKRKLRRGRGSGREGRGLVGRPRLTAVPIVWHET